MDRTCGVRERVLPGSIAPSKSARIYETGRKLLPDDLLLFLHHVPYTHRLQSGKTVVQYIYDSHYAGASAVDDYQRQWNALKGRVDDERFADVAAQLEYQAGQAIVWRDGVSRWFHRASGIADAHGRVDNYPDRVEAESASLTGYAVTSVKPWETASGDRAVECTTGTTCSAAFHYTGPSGRRDVVVQYFDVNTGRRAFPRSRWRSGHWRVDRGGSNSNAPARRVIVFAAHNPRCGAATGRHDHDRRHTGCRGNRGARLR